jgi:hypothetical protein
MRCMHKGCMRGTVRAGCGLVSTDTIPWTMSNGPWGRCGRLCRAKTLGLPTELRLDRRGIMTNCRDGTQVERFADADDGGRDDLRDAAAGQCHRGAP